MTVHHQKYQIVAPCRNRLVDNGELVLDNRPALHHELDVIEFTHVGDRISRNGDDIGVFARFDSKAGKHVTRAAI
jgi:hypothetical protein